MDPIRDKRGFYVVSPFLGAIFFMMTVSAAAFILNENIQQQIVAEASFSNQLVFVAQAIGADVFEVLMQNKLQETLDEIKIGTSTLRDVIEDASRTSITEDIGDIYSPPYMEKFGIECTHTEAIHSATYVLFSKYGGSRIIDRDATTAIKPLISRYGVECTSEEPEGWLRLDFASKAYHLDAKNICDQLPAACWDV